MSQSMTMGPLQLVVFGFKDPQFTGKIMQDLRDLSQSGTIKVADMVVVNKDAQGKITTAEMSQLSPAERKTYGTIIGALIGVGAGGREGARTGAEMGYEMASEHQYGWTKQNLDQVMDRIPNGSAAAIVAFELTWAAKLFHDVRQAGGMVLGEGLVTAKALVEAGREMAAQQA